MRFTRDDLTQIEQNYLALTEEEKNIFRDFVRSPTAEIVRKVLDIPETYLVDAINTTRSPEPVMDLEEAVLP